MTITDKLNQILEIKNEMKTSLENKGSDINNNTLFSEYSQKILDLPTADTIKVPFMPQIFFRLRTSNFTNFEYLFKDYKGDSLAFYHSSYPQLSYLNSSLKGMFADCSNLKILDMTSTQIAQDNITNGMFENNPALIRVIMNYSEVNSIQRLLDALPDHTGAAEGDYKFEISTPIILFDEVTGICGTMYRGWTITKKTQEQERVEEEEANDPRIKISVIKYDQNYNSINSVQFDIISSTRSNYDEYFLESSYLKDELDSDMYGNIIEITNAIKIVRAQDFCHQFAGIEIDINTIESVFDFPYFIGDYDTENLYYLNIHCSDLGNEQMVSISGENYFPVLDTLYVYGNTAPCNLIMENLVFDCLTKLYTNKSKEVTLSNIKFNKDIETNRLFYIDSRYDVDNNPLESIVFNNVEAPYLTNLSNTFYKCKNLKLADFSGLTIAQSGSIDFSYMFYLCKSLKEVDFSNFNLTNVEYINMRCAFQSCGNLEKVNLSNMNPASIPTSDSMAVESCYKLNTLVMANCPWYFVEYVIDSIVSPVGILYCDMDMYNLLPAGWIWKHSSEYNG